MLLNLNDYTMDKKDVKFSFHAQKTFDLINEKLTNNTILSNFEKEQIIKHYENNLFFFKTTDYGTGCFSKFFSLHLYRLLSVMQENRIKNLYEIKASFINHELNLKGINKITTYYDQNLGKYFNNDDNDNLALLYEQAKKQFKIRNKEEILIFLEKTYLDKNVILPKDVLKQLSKDDKKLQKFYEETCFIIEKDKNGNSFSKIPLNLASKIEDIRKNLKQSKTNARFKAIYNFADEQKISWLTLTLPHHNANGSLSKEVKNYDQTHQLVKKFINKLRYEYRKVLHQKGFKKDKIIKSLKQFKYFIASQIQTKNNRNVWHFHIMFNIDLLKLFGFTNEMMCQKKGLINNSEFLENNQYYEKHQQRYNDKNGWKKVKSKNLIIPNVFKLWADIVNNEKGLSNLKRLNPRSQNLQVFKSNAKIKLEINECQLKQSICKEDSSSIISKYVTKYAEYVGNDKEIQKMILQKKNYLTGKRLFHFSKSCQKLPITKTLKFLPFDLQHPKYQLTNLYLSNILNFDQQHMFFKILRNNILDINDNLFKDKNKHLQEFNNNKCFIENKDKYMSQYIKQKGQLSFFYGIIFYEKKLFDNYLNSAKYFKTCNLINKYFNLTKLQIKKSFKNNLDKKVRFVHFNNYINPLYQYLN
ncbi:MAG: hypothetical protein U9532_01340 ['Conium maculatum' witches'-broom phytoplasma]|nr:hypothetical protein ['Conium maculatum' witches'-broom phytoplasma]